MTNNTKNVVLKESDGTLYRLLVTTFPTLIDGRGRLDKDGACELLECKRRLLDSYLKDNTISKKAARVLLEKSPPERKLSAATLAPFLIPAL